MLKRVTFLFLLLALVLCCSPAVKAQRILGAVSLGMNLTQVDGDEYFGYNKVGLNLGPMVIVPFGPKKNWSASMELLYSQKGSYHRGHTDTTTYWLRLDYAEIPVLFHYTDKKVISGGIGFSYGRLVNFKETINDHALDSTYFAQPTTSMSNDDFSVIADLQIRIWSKLWADVRYQYSMKSNRSVHITDLSTTPRNEYDRDQYNNVITIRLTWVFNQEKISKRPKKESNTETF
jgi:hypothetical protein